MAGRGNIVALVGDVIAVALFWSRGLELTTASMLFSL